MTIPENTPERLLPFLCPEHGGFFTGPDRSWICVGCSRKGISRCSCGGYASIFGEALLTTIACEECNAHFSMMGVSRGEIVQRWNNGERDLL